MELQLGLDLPAPTPNMTISKGFDLNYLDGFELPKEMEDFGVDKEYCGKNKRFFEPAFTEEPKTLPLLLWSGQPNEKEDNKNQKKRTSNFTIDENEAEEDGVVVGWPPIKAWRKKTFHRVNQVNVGRVVQNNNRTNDRSIYVKVKMEGVAIARKIDLRLFHSYQALTNTLIIMFAKYQRYEYEDDYTLTYQDKEGDWLIAGDIPWQSFIRSVQRLKIVRNSG